MVSTAPIAIRRADLADLDAVQRISAEAYIPAYMAALGVIPKPAFENYRPRIERGEVWLLEADGEPAGLIVLEEKPAHVVIYSIAVRPAQQGRGHARSLLQFAAQQAVASGMRELRLTPIPEWPETSKSTGIADLSRPVRARTRADPVKNWSIW